MNYLIEFFNINNTFFTLLGYPISYLEFVGTLFNLTCVWLVARKNILNWPIGLVGVALFGILFYQINLYADLFEQFYFFITGIWGWYMWQNAKNRTSEKDIVIRRNTATTNLKWVIAVIAGTTLGVWVMSNIHIWLAVLFPEPASLPLLDTATTVLSFAATILMMQRKVESWALWILVDIIAVGLYWYKEVPFVALLYLIFLGIATNGLLTWYKSDKGENHETRISDREVLSTA